MELSWNFVCYFGHSASKKNWHFLDQAYQLNLMYQLHCLIINKIMIDKKVPPKERKIN